MEKTSHIYGSTTAVSTWSVLMDKYNVIAVSIISDNTLYFLYKIPKEV